MREVLDAISFVKGTVARSTLMTKSKICGTTSGHTSCAKHQLLSPKTTWDKELSGRVTTIELVDAFGQPLCRHYFDVRLDFIDSYN